MSSTAALHRLVLALVLVSSLVTGSIVMTQSGAASLSGARASDVVGGLTDVEQTITVRGQATENGATNFYEVDVTDIVTSGASVTNVSFRNVGWDDDSVSSGSSVEYSENGHTISFSATEDARDRDTKIDFAVVLTLDTTTLRASGQHRYGVTMYEGSSSDVTLSPQAAQFKVVGAKNLDVETSKPTSGAADATHEARHVMRQRVRGVTSLSVHTKTPVYNTLSVDQVVVTRNGGPDLTRTPRGEIRVMDGGILLIPLQGETTFHRDDTVRVTLHNVTNPPTDSHFTLAFRTHREKPVYVASGRLDVRAACLSALDTGARTGAGAPGFGVLGAAAAMFVVGTVLVRRT